MYPVSVYILPVSWTLPVSYSCTIICSV